MLSKDETALLESLDHLFRRHAGQMVSLLSRLFGYQHLELVEDAVQDALVAALRKWPFTGVPQNPRAWLTEAAKNRVIDQLRRYRRDAVIDEAPELAGTKEVPMFLAGEIEEDELRMIFACCDPSIPPDAQVALTLKTVGGFSVGEIARAFLMRGDTIAKMLTRAKAKLRANAEGFEVPSQADLIERREAALKVLYLMFNEGYAATAGDVLVRKDLCFEAIRLASILTQHSITSTPQANALLALFLFQAARLDTRIDRGGELLLLEDQDRRQWDRAMLAEGLRQFRLSASGNEVSNYHLEAEIASVHALAPDFASTDWRQILDVYDELQRRRFSPLVELNRIVAIEKIEGTARARQVFDALSRAHDLSRLDLFHITEGHLLLRAGDHRAAASAFGRALNFTTNETVRRFVEKKLMRSADEAGPIS